MRQENATQANPTHVGRISWGVRSIATRLGVSAADVSNYLNGKYDKIGRERLEHISKELGKTQKELILVALLSGAKLTPMDAWKLYGCYRLGARIYDLRKEGFDIDTDKSHGYAVYSMERAA